MTTSLWARALSALPDKDQRMFRTSGTASAPVSKTLADIITAIETQRDRCKRHKWSTISIGGKELIIRDVCAKIAACVNKFASVVDVVVSYDPVHAALPWAGVRFVLQLFLNGIDTFGAIVEGLETSVRVIARGGILEGLYYQKNSALSEARQALQDEIVKCYTAVLKFLSLARKYYQCSRMKRAVNFISKDDLRHCTKEIQSAEQQFLIQKGLADSEDLGNIETNVLHTILIATSTADQVNDMKTKLEKTLLDLDKPLIRVVDQVSDLHRALKDNERGQILRWISPVPAQEHYREASASLMPGSGEWLFRHPEFQAWRDSSSSEVLWLYGIPGCGKSKIAYLESLEIYRGKEVSYSIALACLDAYLGENCVENEFLKYATNYWPSHVEDLGFAPQRAKVVPSLTDFFTKEEHFVDWLDNFELQQREGGSSWKSTNERKLDASISTPRTPLFLICCFGFVEILEDDDVVEDLDVNQTNKDGSSGLYLAARGGHIMVVQKLLDMGASIDAPGFKYGDALQAACFEGWTGIVQLLINHGASSSVPRRGEYSSPLQAALASDNKSVAEVLLHAGVKLTTQQQFDDAIETAAFKGNVPIFQRLMAGEAGDFAPKIRPDPLQVALAGGKMRRAKLLLQSCTDINEEKGLFGNALAAAIASERLSIVQLVLDAGANIELRGRYGFPLRAAVIINNFEITKCLLEKGADPNVIDEELGDALQAAASRGSLEIMSLLLAYKAHVRGRGGYFGDTLQAAAFGGHEKAVELLIHHGAKDSLEKPRGRYHSALRAAVYVGHQSIVERLLGAGAKLKAEVICFADCCAMITSSLTARMKPRDALPNVIKELRGLDTLSHLGPLELAAQRGNVILLEMLLVEAAHINSSKADSGLLETSTLALQIAAFGGRTPAVRCLLAHGVNVNAVQHKTGTALQAALEGEQYHIADLLLSHGADIDEHWTKFGSCLQVFSERGKLEVVQFLLDRGANVNDKGGVNGTALQVACDAGHVEVVQLLLQKGADMNAQGKAIGTALHAASANGHLGIVEMLLHHDAKADTVGWNVDTNTHIALQVACANGRREVVESLLDRGAGVRNTLLCRASENGDTSLMQLMLDNGSLVNPETGPPDSKQLEGRSPTDDSSLTATPLHLAAYRGHESAVTFLLDNGADLHVQGILYPMQEQGHHNSDFDFETNTSSPMQAACYKGNSHIAKLLFTRDPWGHIKHQTFTVALKTSLDRGQHEVQRILLLQAVRSGFRAEQFHEAFCHACLKGYTQFVELIFEHFTVDNWPDAILQAAEDGRAGIVKALLLHGADPKMRNESGDTAISLAIRKMSPYCCGFYDGDPPHYRKTLAALVEAGHVLDKSLSADIPHKILRIIIWGNLELLVQLQRSGICLFQEPGSESVEYADVISMLVQNDAQAAHLIRKPFEAAIDLEVVESIRVLIELFAKNDMHRTEICTGILSQILPLSMELLSFLLSQGGDVNTRYPKNNTTLLHRAAARGDEDALRILISYGAQVSLQSGDQGTALHAAVVGGFHGSVNLLLTENAEVDASCTLIGTPLAAVMPRKWKSCCGRYHRSCAEQLIAWGADIDRIDERLGTPMDIAYKAGNNEGVELLLENGALDPKSTAYPLNSDN
nr:hypothetical protein ANI_1_1862064 [Aspergillus niger CBS 513.88]|eukprot:XP_001391675.2 hypothetical protein ANI_1_1862064 [Aspergillus niger CBS 513.88]